MRLYKKNFCLKTHAGKCLQGSIISLKSLTKTNNSPTMKLMLLHLGHVQNCGKTKSSRMKRLIFVDNEVSLFLMTFIYFYTKFKKKR